MGAKIKGVLDHYEKLTHPNWSCNYNVFPKSLWGTVPLLGIYMLMGSNGVGQDGPSTHSGRKKIVQ